MKAAIYARYIGGALILAGGLVLLVLMIWWLKFGVWVQLSLVDAVSLLSVSTSAAMGVWLSNSDILWFVFADSPLYALMLATGAVLLTAGGTKVRETEPLTPS